MLPGSELLGLRLVVGSDTLRLDDWTFTTSVTEISIDAPRTVEFTSTQGGVTVTLAYTFRPDAYQIGVEGSVSGVGPNGGLLLVGMGPGLANTEANLRGERARDGLRHQGPEHEVQGVPVARHRQGGDGQRARSSGWRSSRSTS